MREIPVIDPPSAAYRPIRRLRNAFWFVREMARSGSAALEATKSVHVGPTYGLPVETVKRIKARFRNELSFSGEGK